MNFEEKIPKPEIPGKKPSVSTDKIQEVDLDKAKASLGPKTKEIFRQHLKEYLGMSMKTKGLESADLQRIDVIKAKDLPDHYKKQYEALGDKRLENIAIAVIPDDMWVKGDQPTESQAEHSLILIKESYFKNPKNPDEICWMIHELAHCKRFFDSGSNEKYQQDMQTRAFEDIESEHTYPNNPVEGFAFGNQFEYLKSMGRSREDITKMLEKYYDKKDFPFFNRLLDKTFA